MVKYQFRTIKNWLQSKYVCEQRHMLRMVATSRISSASLNNNGEWEALGDQWHGMVSCKSHKGCTVSGR